MMRKFSAKLMCSGMVLLVLLGIAFHVSLLAYADSNFVQNPGFESGQAWTARYSSFFGTYAKVQDSAYQHTGSYSGLTQTTTPKQEYGTATLYQSLSMSVQSLSTFSYWIRKGSSAPNGYNIGDVCLYLSGGYTLEYYHGFDGSSPPADSSSYKYVDVGNPSTNTWVQISRSIYNDLVTKFGTSILTQSITEIDLNSEGYMDLDTHYKYGQRVNWDDISLSGSVYCTVSLTSSTSNGQTNTGTITFAGTVYTLPNSTQQLAGPYLATGNPPSSYFFDHWETSGGVTVSGNTSQTTTVTVNNAGTLKAVFGLTQFNITLTSETTYGPTNVGTITFAGVTYSLPNSTMKGVGSYSVTGNPPVNNGFVSWVTTGLVSVTNANAQTTTATVSGAGTLKAIFAQQTKWTFMVYMCADNNLESWGYENINKMEQIGSTSNVSIVVQFDGDDTNGLIYAPGKKSPPGMKDVRYYITQDNDTDTVTSPIKVRLGEIDMGDPNTLVNFVEWSIRNYPAQQYALILWDHGGGFQGICFDDEPKANIPAPWPLDNLSMPKLKSALQQVQTDTGVTVNLVGCDACLMAQVEVAYQIRGLTQVYVASEETESAVGWPYDWVLGNLTANPNMTPQQFGTQIVTSYSNFYSNPNYAPEPIDTQIDTMAAIDMSRITSVAQSMSDIGNWLSTNMGTAKPSIDLARQNVYEYSKYPGVGNYDYVDAYNLVQLLRQSINDTGFQQKCDTATSNIASAVIAEWAGTNATNSHGLHIFFPDITNDYQQYSALYNALDMSINYLWNTFLKNYLGIS